MIFIHLHADDVFIVNSNDETLSRYDTNSCTLDNHILQLGQYANQIVVKDTTGYVINSGVHNIQVIDLETVSTTGYISCPNGSNPYWIVIHPNGEKAYVTGLFTNSVYVIDLDEKLVSITIPVGSAPEGMVIYGNNCYVMNSSFGSSNGSVSVIDMNINEVVHTIHVGNNPQYAAVDDLGRLHVVCTGNYGYGNPAIWGKIYIIDSENFSDVTILDIGGSPTKIAIHPNGTAYLADGFGCGYMAYNSHDLSIMHSSTDLWASGGSFIQFDEDGSMYLGDSMDWINNGRVYIYSEDEQLLNTLTVGVNPQDAGFYYPGVGVDVQPQETITTCNCPNPFSNSTKISFSLTTDLHELSRIEIYNIKGQMIKQLDIRNSDLEISYNISSHSYLYQATWNGTNDYNNAVPNGVYLYKIIADGVETAFQIMILLR